MTATSATTFPRREAAHRGEFVKAYKAKYTGETPNAMAALGYDAVKLVADAAKRAGSSDRKALRDAIESTKDFAGVTGQITIDKQHNAVKSAVIVKIDASGPNTPVSSRHDDLPLRPAARAAVPSATDQRPARSAPSTR